MNIKPSNTYLVFRNKKWIISEDLAYNSQLKKEITLQIFVKLFIMPNNTLKSEICQAY